jgi:hypothetical protein
LRRAHRSRALSAPPRRGAATASRGLADEGFGDGAGEEEVGDKARDRDKDDPLSEFGLRRRLRRTP